nr:hypothetical protein Iba_chr06aCG13560 [Ipomoea batatas]
MKLPTPHLQNSLSLPSSPSIPLSSSLFSHSLYHPSQNFYQPRLSPLLLRGPPKLAHTISLDNGSHGEGCRRRIHEVRAVGSFLAKQFHDWRSSVLSGELVDPRRRWW